ncbi:MAG: methylated-DNA--[protein]-cysteine S-methyltransferase [Desulfobacterales bacterium]|nr:methylated-DNA--[protein]-cysteine S-methyltransferase [Desulfobacterales bacterium]
MASKIFGVFYQIIPSAIGEIGIIWGQKNAAPLIIHIMLPQKDIPVTERIIKNWPDALERSHENLKKLFLQIQNFLEGFPVSFSLKFIDMNLCYDFQKRVLLETIKIPRGKVISYGRLADRILAPKAARAVGSALARNPFPLIIPCHRVIKSTRYPGNFGGGPETKRFLLKMEDVPSNAKGKISPEKFLIGS